MVSFIAVGFDFIWIGFEMMEQICGLLPVHINNRFIKPANISIRLFNNCISLLKELIILAVQTESLPTADKEKQPGSKPLKNQCSPKIKRRSLLIYTEK
jgi:hypothetical protein